MLAFLVGLVLGAYLGHSTSSIKTFFKTEFASVKAEIAKVVK